MLKGIFKYHWKMPKIFDTGGISRLASGNYKPHTFTKDVIVVFFMHII